MGCCTVKSGGVICGAVLLCGLSLVAGLIHQGRSGKIPFTLDAATAASGTSPSATKPSAPAQVPPAPPTATPAPTNPPVPAKTAPAVKPAMPAHHVDLAQAKALYDGGMTHFVDARTEEDFAKGRISGAMFIPPSAFFNGKLPDEVLTGRLIRAWNVVVYCNGGDCDASENVAIRLKEQGFNPKVFHEGFPAWKAAGYPIEGAQP